MLEKQRLIYLESLGIENYMPRRLLSGAAPSPLLADELLQEPTAFSTADISEQVVEAKTAVNVEQATKVTDALDKQPISADNAPSIAALLSGESGESAGGNVETELEKTSDAASSTHLGGVAEGTANEKSASEAIRFTLTSWRVADLLVIDSRESASALPTDRLLQNILRSIGYSVAQLPSSEILRWPLFTGGQFASASTEQERTEAIAMIQAYIEAQCQKSTTRAVVLMGQNACNYALAPEEPREDFFIQQQGSAQFHERWQIPVLVTPSLNDMLLEPVQKRITWQALQMFLNL